MVTGATGTIGKALVRKLQAINAPFVVGVRDKEKAKNLLNVEDGEIRHFDFSDTSSYASATEGVDAVFLLGPPVSLDVYDLVTPFVDFLKAQGILRVVYVSALGADKMGDMLDFHKRMEEKLAADGFDFTILKPSFFAQNFKNYEWENITQRNITYVTAGEGKAGFVDVDDIAAVAAKALTEDGHGGKSYRLTGPESLTYAEAAELLTKVTGRHIVYPNPTPEEYTAALKGAGAPDFIAPYMIAVYSIIARNEADLVTNDVEEVTGQKPTALRVVLERDFKA